MKKTICLFDIDGTLTKSRNKIQKSMVDCLNTLKNYTDVGLVGGSDQKKIKQQIGQQVIKNSTYFFSQNGLMAFKNGQLIGKQAISTYLSEEKLKKFINFNLKYLADIQIPVKRGTFIQYRTGMIKISPIGRNCSQQQRDAFQIYDKEHQIRKKHIQALRKQFQDFNLTFSIGGQISFDCMPRGWDKTYCLRFLSQYDQIYFFGDKTDQGGNDYEIYQQIKKTGRAYSIKKGPQQTISILTKLFFEKEKETQKS